MKLLKFLFVLFLITFQPILSHAWSWLDGGDHNNLDWVISSNVTVAGHHYNVKDFLLTEGTTIWIEPVPVGLGTYGYIKINAETITINGTVYGNGRGYPGGTGGTAQPTVANGGNAGSDGYPTDSDSRGKAGGVGLSSATVSGSGAGGGSGGGYGGNGADGGVGGKNANQLSSGAGGSKGLLRGTTTGSDIAIGAGGAGAGGGGAGGGANPEGGLAGGDGGAGGGCVILDADDYIIINGTITVNGADGGAGGNGGGPSEYGGGGGSGAGGGSGGGILFEAKNTITISTSSWLTANGGNGGLGGNAGVNGGGSGVTCGSGSGGRIKLIVDSFQKRINNYGTLRAKGGNLYGSIGDDGTTYVGYIAGFNFSGDFPEDESGVVSASILLDWSATDSSGNSLSYELYLSNAINGSSTYYVARGTLNDGVRAMSIAYDLIYSGASTSYTITSLEVSKTYYWYIKATDTFGNTTQTQIRSFSTADLEPDKIFNYPNPFDPADEPTNIVFKVDTSQTVKIKIYSEFGDLLHEAEMSAIPGTNEYQYDGKDITGDSLYDGSYICRVERTEGTSTCYILVLND